MPKSFDDYNPDPGRNGANCPRCNKEGKAGAVSVRLMKFSDKNASRTESVTSRQIAMCEACCIELYEELANNLSQGANGGSRPARSPRSTLPLSNPPRRKVGSK